MPESTTIQPTQVVTSQAPQSRLSGADIAQPYMELSRSLDKAGQGLEQLAEPFAERAGTQAVTRDDQGNLQTNRIPVFGEAGDVYARAVKMTALADAEGEAKRRDIDLRTKYQDDPEGYNTAANSYRDKTVQQLTDAAGPEVGLAIGRAIDSSTTFTYRSLVMEKQHQIRENFNRSTGAAIESKTQDLVDLVSTGGADTPEAKRLVGDIHALSNERVSNPVLGEPQEVADLRLKDLHQRIGAAGATYRTNQLLQGGSPFQGNINTAAQKYGINPIILARQLHQESGLNPNVPDSAAGAQGIAQFMPATAQRYGVNPRDPNSSIEGAAHYMSDLDRMFSGNTGLALAAYNWGEGHVAQWMATGANPAAMPAETRNYVQSITGQPIDKWLAGQRPSAANIIAMGAPTAATGNVQRAVSAAQDYLNDQSLTPTQRMLNYNAAMKAISEFRENNVRVANINAQQQKQTDDAFENKVIIGGTGENPPVTDNEIRTNTDISPETKMRMLSWVKREDMPEPMARVSQGNSIDLFRRINLPDGDAQKITSTGPIRDAYIQGQLTRADEEWLEKRFTDSRAPGGERLSQVRAQFTHAIEPVIDKSNPLLGSIDESGKLQSYAFQRFVDQKVDEYRAGGKNPLDLFDPAKPDYLGKPETLQPFKLQQSMQNVVKNLTGSTATAAPVVPRKPNETPAAYLARISGSK